jgi:Spx/MgsR family transcriptional regulator
MHPIVYGIPNCDTVKKARTWLSAHGLEASFHDFKKQGLPAAELDTWLDALGWESLLNRKGTTWRQLDAAVQAGVTDKATAKAVMQEHTSTLKRPVIAWPGGSFTVGFKPEQWPV